jgi:hypothetical protein
MPVAEAKSCLQGRPLAREEANGSTPRPGFPELRPKLAS